MNLLIAPHSDDEGLFATYICLRTHPLVVVLTDGTTHQEKFGIDIEVRRDETRAACQLMDVPVEFGGVDEKELSMHNILRVLDKYSPDLVFAPLFQLGNPHHDIVSMAAWRMFGDSVLYYSTYGEDSLEMLGEMPIHPTEGEAEIKKNVLDCYNSQHEINAEHFTAVWDRPEYLNFNQNETIHRSR